MTTEPTSDERLVQQALNGCIDSFEALVARYQVPLVQFLSQRIHCVEDAEDLTQETMVRAYQQLHRYRSNWRFSTWLFTIARRLSINHQRHHHAQCRDRGRQQPDSLSRVADTRGDPSMLTAKAEDQRRLWALVAGTLSEPKFTVLWLFYVEELPILEIARVVGRSRVAVKTMMFRARKQLLPILEGEHCGSTNIVLAADDNRYEQLAERLLATRHLVAAASGA